MDGCDGVSEKSPFAKWWGDLSQDQRTKMWPSFEFVRNAFLAGRASALDEVKP
jgi:hypothetical protein